MAKVIVGITKADVQTVISAQNGKIFTAKFQGKDGRPHSVNGRTGVRKFSKGGVNHAEGKRDLITTFSMPKMAYRNVTLPGVTEIRANGVIYKVIG